METHAFIPISPQIGCLLQSAVLAFVRGPAVVVYGRNTRRKLRSLDVQYVFRLPDHPQPAVVAVSAFDGVHSGHRRLLAETETIARQQGVRPIALLPWPPAAEDTSAREIVTTLRERLALIERFAPAVEVMVLPAAASEPWSTVALVERITSGWNVAALLLDPASEDLLSGTKLAEAASQRDVPVRLLDSAPGNATADPIETRVRAALAAGKVSEAARLLTYDYSLSAEVVGGDRRGRLLGFPTANLRVDANKVIPANGIYAVRVGLPGDSGAYRPAVASVGVRPTFGDGNARLVEVHLLDVSIDLYGTRIETAFVEWLRSEERFASVEALIAQMSADVAQARERLARSA